MGDLHSIAYSNSSLHSSSLCWDAHNLGVFNADMSHFMESTPPFFSPLDSDISTGYLQDALFEFSDRSKRRRLLFFTNEQTKDSSYPIENYWNSTQIENSSENHSYLSQITTNTNGFSGESINRSVSRMSEDATMFSEMKTPEEAISASENFDSSSSSHRDSVNTKSLSDKETLYSIDPISPSGGGDNRKKRVITRVVYPFALVKPGGVEGDMTLNDINQRILMPPTRPVRHPVGDFACRPQVSPDGPGLSGKAVVALTRIHTQGRGTITIIRTKG
uniref:Protein XRI1 n=1 Tax=Davidia involucrata TaxID=16924 RepID=A0A5B7B5H8_DAVIN